LKDSNPQLIVEDLKKSYSGHSVVKSLNLSLNRGEFVSLLGPSGCGKTTTLRMIGGFEEPDSGTITMDDRVINHIPPHRRPINTVFQQYALFPHLTVGGNIAFGMECAGKDRKHIRRMTGEMLDLVNLPGLENRAIHSLSGGQQQRVAIARALVNHPSLLLLDEPLGALDLKLRQNMQEELKRIQQQVGITFLYVTHDQEEALTLSDRIGVMEGGVLQQWGTPEDIYNEPRNSFVASFVGESNILDGDMIRDRKVRFCGREFRCVDRKREGHYKNRVVIRPEDIRLRDPSEAEEKENALSGRVLSALFKGVHWEMAVESHGLHWKVHSTAKAEPGDNVAMIIKPDAIHVMFEELPG